MRSYRRSGYSRRTAPVVSRPRRSTQQRRAFGNMVSAMQQRDATNIVCNATEEVTLYVPTDCNQATLVRNVNAILTTCPMYMNYATMYDQFKLNAVRVSCEMTYIGNQLLNSATFPSICTAWDRNGIRPTVRKVDENSTGFELPIYDTVASYSSANEKTLYYGSRWGVIRQIDATSMMEKSIYVGTLNTKDILTTDNLYSCWNPQLLISLKCPRSVSSQQTCILQLHYQFDVTLRGLRKIVLDSYIVDGTAEPATSAADNTIANINRLFKPNSNFLGYKKNNGGAVIKKTDGTGYIVVTGDGANVAVGAAVSTLTVNPSMSENAPYVNEGLYVPVPGVADSNLKL